jgi:tetratricopeptide (TPR) repeat protein
LSKASQIRQKAQECLSKGQIDKAIQEYRRLLSIESKNPNLYNELGDIYLRASDKAQAVQNFEKASTIYEKVALYNNAVAVCKKILRIEPERADTIFKLSELRAKQKLEGDAVTFFSQYVECVLANPQSLLQGAQKSVERMLELMPTSEPILANVVEIYEQLGLKLKTAELCSKLSSMAQERGDSKKQVLYSRKAEELKSGLAPEEREEMGRIVPDGGGAPAVSASAEGNASEAEQSPPEGTGLEEPSETASAAPEDSSPEKEKPSHEFENRAPDSGPAEGDIDPTVREAVEEAEMVAAMSGGQEPFEHGAGSCEGSKRVRKEAPFSARAETKPAVSPAKEAKPVAPPAKEEHRAVFAPAAGEPAGQTSSDGPNNLAEEITSDVEKDDLRSHYDLGMAYLEMGLYTEAIKDFQISSRYAELQLSSMEMIGYCFLKHNQPRLAVKQLTHALEIAKNSSAENLGIHYNLGLAHEMLGELGAAKEHFEEVYIIDMAFRDVSEKMKKLNTAS